MLYLDQEFRELIQAGDPFEQLSSMEGKVYREVKGRKTQQFSIGGRSYFVKLHFGIGWAEVVKNLLQFRMPILGAENEWRAIAKLQALGLATMKTVAYGSRGWNPAARRSFIVTEDLSPSISLEDYCADWLQNKPTFKQKTLLLEKIAHIARTLHQAGVCHRDFYLCHFLLDQTHNGESTTSREAPKLSLIDLHRALIKSNLGSRWKVKDISGLYYSAMNIGLTKRDILRFIKLYNATSLRICLSEEKGFWHAVETRADTMYQKLGPAVVAS